ncbi:type I secretion C-terminal target domain-containing protein, partial [Vogesella facilis]
VAEGSDAVFSVDISGAAAGSSVTLTLAPSGTYQATEGTDYKVTTFQYSFNGTDWFSATEGASISVPAGSSSLQVKTDTFNDTIDEQNETFTLTAVLSSLGSNYSDNGVGTITDNDTPAIQVNDISVNEGDMATFTVDISSAASGSTVSLTLAPSGTYPATEGTDYKVTTFQYSFNGTDWFSTTEGASISVPAGSSTMQVRTDTYNDSTYENNETFTLSATLNSLGTNYSDSGTATIVDNDFKPPVLYADGGAWQMNLSSDHTKYDMRAKSGDITLFANRTIHWDIWVDNVAAAGLILSATSVPTGTSYYYEKLYTANGDTLFRFYLTAGNADVVMSQNSASGQFEINLSGATITSSTNVHIINSDEYVLPHSNYPDNYATSFDTGTASSGDNRDWLSSDTNGGELALGSASQTGQTVDSLAGNDMTYGTLGNDTLSGGTGDDFIDGRSGNDTIHGNDGNDVLMGGLGDDTIYGDAGNDTIYGGFGNDTLIGGAGSDTFKWALGDQGQAGAPTIDTIKDFQTGAGGDVLDLKDLLRGENSGNLTNYLHFTSDGTNTVVQVSSAGQFNGSNYDATADQRIVLEGVNLTGGDAAIIDQLKNNNNLKTD